MAAFYLRCAFNCDFILKTKNENIIWLLLIELKKDFVNLYKKNKFSIFLIINIKSNLYLL